MISKFVGMASILDSNIMYVTGVGEVRARLLDKELGVRTFRDMLYHFPFRYVDRTKVYHIAELNENISLSYIQIKAKVISKGYAGEGPRHRFSVFVSDGSGMAEMIWFNGIKWIENRIEVGREYVIFGRPSFFRGEVSIIHPEMELVEKVLSRKVLSGLQGIYSTTDRLQSAVGTKGIYNIICSLWSKVQGHIDDYMPDDMRKDIGLISLEEALYNIHFPQSSDALARAQHRLKFDELLGIQLNIQSRRSGRLERRDGFVFTKVGDLFNTFYSNLPYPLTSAQKRVIKEIRNDTVSGVQMNRLLQGDVGSGKTIVALASMILAVDNGFQACIMAPTEILARQHFKTFSRMTENIGIRVEVLTGTTKKKERESILADLESGRINILIGTHALIEERVKFSNLGFVVIDEQHRFGVEQRSKLWTKNLQPPHILVMTATPIPRTLAMTLYGDLDVSVIDELPPGRKPIKTFHFDESARLKVFGFLRKQIAEGRQVYIVYPLIKQSEKLDYKNLHEGFMAITRDFPLPKYNVTPCHGQMKAADKEESMRQFVSGESDILVATSVIEVGVDVPNATVMVIESAQRFGLAQLHQLRGRVGRGGDQSYCILMSDDNIGQESNERLQAMCETNDGFKLAELDLKLRGAGDIGGTMQSGEAFSLQLANPTKDTGLVQQAQQIAIDILSMDPQLETIYGCMRSLKERYSPDCKEDFSMIS